MIKEKQFERIVVRIKKHLNSIKEYYATGEDYYVSPLVLNAVRREQENIVSLVRQLMEYEDLLEKIYKLDDSFQLASNDDSNDLPQPAFDDDTLPF